MYPCVTLFVYYQVTNHYITLCVHLPARRSSSPPLRPT